MNITTFEHNDATIYFAATISPGRLRDVAKAEGMTAARARNLAEQAWGLKSVTSDAIFSTISADAAVHLSKYHGIVTLVFQAGASQHRLVFPFLDSDSCELVSRLLRDKEFKVEWRTVDSRTNDRTTRHRLSDDTSLPALEPMEFNGTDSENAVVMGKVLTTLLRSLTSRESVPSLIQGKDVEAVAIAVVYDPNMRSLPRIMSGWSSNLKKAESLARHASIA